MFEHFYKANSAEAEARKAEKECRKYQRELMSVEGIVYRYCDDPKCLQCIYERNKENKMTREEATDKLRYLPAKKDVFYLITQLETLGLLKFEEKKEIKKLFEFMDRSCTWANADVAERYGTIRLEEWPEGLVLWVGGEIKWKSWETYFTPQDLYNRHVSSDSPSNDKCISIFGYTLKELAGIIHKNRNSS